MHKALSTGESMLPGTTEGAWEFIPILIPVGAQSTNCTERFPLILDIATFTSFGVTSPRYITQQDIYFPCRGSHLVIIDSGSNSVLVISWTDIFSCSTFDAGTKGAYDWSIK